MGDGWMAVVVGQRERGRRRVRQSVYSRAGMQSRIHHICTSGRPRLSLSNATQVNGGPSPLPEEILTSQAE